MKRTFIVGLFGLSAAALLGCPVFSGGGGSTVGPCGAGYACCTSNLDCQAGEYCDGYGCVPVDSGSGGDGQADSGDCTKTGCPNGQTCEVVSGKATCVAGDGSSGADGSDAGDTAPPFTGCTSNAACADAGVGYLCLDGKCVAPADQCTDATQCPDSEVCVQGACVPQCTPGGATSTCPSGYSCTAVGGDAGGASGVCTGNPTPCGTADGGGTCIEGTTCVDQHCVPKCSSGDAACGPGLVCVDNGCIPDQQPVFVCNTDDKIGDGKKGDCDVGSICLHHSCYFTCAAEGGASTCITKTGDMFPVCKAVTDSSGTNYVCGSNSNLGSECDPTSTPPKTCSSGKICIDGYCR